MTPTLEAWTAVAVMSAVTILLRAMPLLMHRSILRTPWIVRLNQDLPLCVMIILVLHSLGSGGTAAPILAEVLALGTVAASYLRWRNALVSVVIGLAALAVTGLMLGK